MASKKIINDEQGAILLVVLLIMFSLVATTAGLAFVIINEIRQSRDVDYSIVAYYAAESAVEQGLFQLRKGESKVSDLNRADETLLDNGASWTRTAADRVKQIYSPIAEQNQELTVDLYNLDDLNEDPGIGSIKIAGSDDTAWLEATLVEWPVGADLNWNSQPTQNIYKTLHILSGEDIYLNQPRSGQNYILRLKSLYSGIENNLAITVWANDDGAGGQKDILGRVTITAAGNYRHSRQDVTVSLPRRVPLSGVYDYILFSENSLIKEIL